MAVIDISTIARVPCHHLRGAFASPSFFQTFQTGPARIRLHLKITAGQAPALPLKIGLFTRPRLVRPSFSSQDSWQVIMAFGFDHR
jgi:hypothetical protein